MADQGRVTDSVDVEALFKRDLKRAVRVFKQVREGRLELERENDRLRRELQPMDVKLLEARAETESVKALKKRIKRITAERDAAELALAKAWGFDLQRPKSDISQSVRRRLRREAE